MATKEVNHRLHIIKRKFDFDMFEERELGNDVTFFGRVIKHPRLQIGFDIGWILERTRYDNKLYYSLLPPGNFECARNGWASIGEEIIIDDIRIAVPSFFFNDNVLLNGTY